MCPPTVFFFFKIVLAALGLLHFHVNSTISLSISATKASGILIETAFDLQINLGRYCHLNSIMSSNP